jgi:DNA replication protein
MTFAGFPPGTRDTPVPGPLLGPLLEQIDDLDELRCTLRIIWLLHHKKGHPRLLTEAELRSDPTLARLMGDTAEERRRTLDQALVAAVLRGTLIAGSLRKDEARVNVYTLNTEAHRQALEKRGLGPPSAPAHAEGDMDDTWAGSTQRPNAYAVYEQNIGMLTPLVADQIRKAEEIYPAGWIEDAIKEAVTANARNWRYVSRVLERWEIQGKTDGRSERHPAKTRRESYY